MDQEGLVQLAQLPLHQPRADHINDPHLHILCRNLQGAGDVCVGQAARSGGRGERGQGEESDLAQQEGRRQTAGLEELVVGFEEVVVVVQQLGAEELEELEPIRFALPEGLDGVAGGEVLEGEVGRVGEGGFEGAEGEIVGVVFGCFVGGDCAQGADEVVVGFVVVAGFGGEVGNLEEEGSLVFVVDVPELDPEV